MHLPSAVLPVCMHHRSDAGSAKRRSKQQKKRHARRASGARACGRPTEATARAVHARGSIPDKSVEAAGAAKAGVSARRSDGPDIVPSNAWDRPMPRANTACTQIRESERRKTQPSTSPRKAPIRIHQQVAWKSSFYSSLRLYPGGVSLLKCTETVPTSFFSIFFSTSAMLCALGLLLWTALGGLRLKQTHNGRGFRIKTMCGLDDVACVRRETAVLMSCIWRAGSSSSSSTRTRAARCSASGVCPRYVV